MSTRAGFVAVQRGTCYDLIIRQNVLSNKGRSVASSRPGPTRLEPGEQIEGSSSVAVTRPETLSSSLHLRVEIMRDCIPRRPIRWEPDCNRALIGRRVIRGDPFKPIRLQYRGYYFQLPGFLPRKWSFWQESVAAGDISCH